MAGTKVSSRNSLTRAVLMVGTLSDTHRARHIGAAQHWKHPTKACLASRSPVADAGENIGPRALDSTKRRSGSTRGESADRDGVRHLVRWWHARLGGSERRERWGAYAAQTGVRTGSEQLIFGPKGRIAVTCRRCHRSSHVHLKTERRGSAAAAGAKDWTTGSAAAAGAKDCHQQRTGQRRLPARSCSIWSVGALERTIG
jgi:hypothetical protein